MLNLLFCLVLGKLSEQGQVETWVAVQCGSLTKENGQPGPGALKATNSISYYMSQSNLPNILVRQAGPKPIICLLFTVSDKCPYQTEIQSLAGLLPLRIQVLGGSAPPLWWWALKRNVLES